MLPGARRSPLLDAKAANAKERGGAAVAQQASDSGVRSGPRSVKTLNTSSTHCIQLINMIRRSFRTLSRRRVLSFAVRCWAHSLFSNCLPSEVRAADGNEHRTAHVSFRAAKLVICDGRVEKIICSCCSLIPADTYTNEHV